MKLKIPNDRTSGFRSDLKQTETLKKVAKRSAKKAIRESKALGLTIKYLKNGILYSESPEGIKEVIQRPVKSKTSKIKSLKLKKGMIFHAKD
jgi:hypothetical protein